MAGLRMILLASALAFAPFSGVSAVVAATTLNRALPGPDISSLSFILRKPDHQVYVPQTQVRPQQVAQYVHPKILRKQAELEERRRRKQAELNERIYQKYGYGPRQRYYDGRPPRYYDDRPPRYYDRAPRYYERPPRYYEAPPRYGW